MQKPTDYKTKQPLISKQEAYTGWLIGNTYRRRNTYRKRMYVLFAPEGHQ